MAAAAAVYGGQAVMEGVMMRGPAGMAVAVRAPDGRIVVDTLARPMPAAVGLAWRLPLLRGLGALADSLALGMRALLYSAEVAVAEPGSTESAVPPPDAAAAAAGRAVPPGTAAASVAGPARGLGWSMAASLLVGVGLFILLPAVVAGRLRPILHTGFLTGLAEGAIRLALLLGYMAAISAMSEVRRVLQFHGAEHKAIAALEAGLPLQVVAVARCSRFHPRCGTSFLLFVVLLAGFGFALLGWESLWVRVVLRLLLLPLLAALGYELLRASARGSGALGRLVTAPGLWLQRLTTREPDAAQVEVALAALGRAMDMAAEDPGRLGQGPVAGARQSMTARG